MTQGQEPRPETVEEAREAVEESRESISRDLDVLGSRLGEKKEQVVEKAEAVKEYFLNYNEALSNDFVLSNGGRDVHLLGTDISNWRITFCDTGARATIGERSTMDALRSPWASQSA